MVDIDPPQQRDAESAQELGKNIRDDFEDVLNNDADFGGAFSFHKEFPDAPNPWLSLGRLGTVGLPLSVREAAAIKDEAKQAPFGMGERTVVDTRVRDTWEMDASEVTIENPKWQVFIADVVSRTCRALGVDPATIQPRCELYKLLLYEEGSHFLPHVDTEKQDGMFATIIIVLPSAYTGGAAHLTHNGQTVVYDCSKNSKTTTSAMAWYTDITHEIKPVESGFRLALSYNLIRTTHSLRPPIQSNERMTAALDRILRAWAANPHSENAPAKLIYRLDHSYSKANLNGSALKGFDAQRVALLQPVAKKHGFRLGLAQLSCHLTGIWDEYDDGYKSEDELHKRFAQGSVDLECAEITHLVDLDGEVISDKLEYWMGDETIPEDIAHGLERTDPDDEEYEQFTGNDGGELERWYHHAVLVIWPGDDKFMLETMGQDGLDNAHRRVIDSISATTEAQRDPADLAVVLRRCEIDPRAWEQDTSYAQTICEAAIAWDDPQLWRRCVEKCKRFAKLPAECKWAAIQKWGFEAVRQYFDKGYEDSPSAYNEAKVSFLLKFIDWLVKLADSAQTDPRPESLKDCQNWIIAQVQGTVDRLGRFYPNEYYHCQELVRLICAGKGASLDSESTLKKIAEIPDARIVENMAKALDAMENVPDNDAKLRAVATIFGAALMKADLIRIPYTQDPGRMAPQQYVKTCVKLKCEQHIALVLTMLIKGPPDADIETVHEYAQKLFSPLVHFWTTYEPVLKHAPEPLENLRKVTIGLLLDSLAVAVGSSTLEALLKVAIKNGQTELLISEVIPRLKAMPTLSETDFDAALEEVSWKEFGTDENELRRLLKTVFEHDGPQVGTTRPPTSPEHKTAPAQKKRRI